MFFLSFWLLDLQCTIPYPNYMYPPVWLYKWECILYSGSTHLHNWLRLYYPTIFLSSMVCFRYCNTCLKVYVYSLMLLVTLVHSNDILGSILGVPHFATQSNFSTMECRMSASLFSSLVELFSIFCRPFFA